MKKEAVSSEQGERERERERHRKSKSKLQVQTNSMHKLHKSKFTFESTKGGEKKAKEVGREEKGKERGKREEKESLE